MTENQKNCFDFFLCELSEVLVVLEEELRSLEIMICEDEGLEVILTSMFDTFCLWLFLNIFMFLRLFFGGSELLLQLLSCRVAAWW